MSDKPPISKRETTPPSRTQSTRKSTRSRGERTALSANAEEIQLQRCKICKWSGKSLRCHLRRNSQCAKDYDKQALEKQAHTARKKKKADWESANRKQRTERMRKPPKSKGLKRSSNACQICERSFSLRENLERHINDVHNESKKFSCPKCPETFSRRDNLDRHVARGKHSFIKNCKFCKETIVFKSDQAMNKHFVRDPPKTGDITCVNKMKRNVEPTPSTSKSSLTSKDLPTHNWFSPRRTTKERPKSACKVTCEVCELQFASKQVKDRHLMEQHSDPDRIQCPECSNTFSRKDKFVCHLATVHGGKEQNVFTCYHCKKTFTDRLNLESHIYDVHKKIKRYECPDCPEEFSRLSTLKRHMERNKHTFLYECEYCGKEIFAKTMVERRKHFLFYGRKRKIAYSCINFEKELAKVKFNWTEDRERREREKKELDEMEERGELSKEEVMKIYEYRDEYEYEYNPYDHDPNMLDPRQRKPMHYPVRSKCGHIFDRAYFIEDMKRYPHMSDWCPLRKGKANGCLEKICLSDLETDDELSEEITKRKEERKRQKEAGLWTFNGWQDSEFTPPNQDWQCYQIVSCTKCDRFFQYPSYLERHNKEVHFKSLEESESDDEKKIEEDKDMEKYSQLIINTWIQSRK